MPDQLPVATADGPLESFPVVSDAAFAQDVAPHSQSFDVLTARLAEKIPEWTNKEGSPGARAAAFLRTMRNAAGLTQANLGEIARIKQSDISSLENSDSPQGPSFDVIARVADACGFHLTFEAKSSVKRQPRHALWAKGKSLAEVTGRLKDATISKRSNKAEPTCYLLLRDGSLKPFKGSSPVVKRDGRIIVKDPAGVVFEVIVDSPSAKVEIKSAKSSIAAAIHQREGR